MIQLQPAKQIKGSIRDLVYETLKHNIMHLLLEPGRYISEKDVMEMMNVSRTPIREALVRLAQEDLIETIPQKGSLISLIDLDHVEEARFVREQVETAIVREACQQFNAEQILNLQNMIALQQLAIQENDPVRLFEYDEQFHQQLYAGCNKRRTWATLQQMSSHLHRIRLLRLSANSDYAIIVDQHQRIVNAIRDRKPDEAEKVLKEHLNRLKLEKIELQRQYPTYFK